MAGTAAHLIHRRLAVEDIDHSRTKTKSPQNKWNRSVSSRRVDEQVVSCGVVIPDPDPERRASSRAIALLRNRKFVDSLLERDEFELPVSAADRLTRGGYGTDFSHSTRSASWV